MTGRSAPRNPIEVAIHCRPYASSGDTRAAEGVMRNFSSTGSYVETCEEFSAGTILIVRIVGNAVSPLSSTNGEVPRSIGIAEVKWRQRLEDDPWIRYGMGLRYLD